MLNITTYLREDYTTKTQQSLVILRFWLNNARIELSTGVKVNQANWNKNKCIIRKAEPNAADLNTLIGLARTRINNIIIKYRLSEQTLTADLLKSEFNDPLNHSDFIIWMENEIEERKGLLTPLTIKNHFAIHRAIKEFSPSLKFSSITKATIEKFEKHLRLKKNRITTVEKKLKVFRAYLNRAKELNLIKESPFAKVTIKRGKYRFDYLEDYELKIIVKYFYSEEITERYIKTLRPFLFSCATGLRLSDVKGITYKHIDNNIIILKPQKLRNVNEKTIKVPLTEFAKGIINDTDKLRVAGPIFDTFSDQKTNKYLKDIATHLGIEKRIKFNMGRHTFATLFIQETKDLATLKELLGHANIAQTMQYAHVTEKAKREGLQRLDKMFNL